MNKRIHLKACIIIATVLTALIALVSIYGISTNVLLSIEPMLAQVSQENAEEPTNLVEPDLADPNYSEKSEYIDPETGEIVETETDKLSDKNSTEDSEPKTTDTQKTVGTVAAGSSEVKSTQLEKNKTYDFPIAFDGSIFKNNTTGEDITEQVAALGLTKKSSTEITMQDFSFETTSANVFISKTDSLTINVKGTNSLICSNTTKLSIDVLSGNNMTINGDSAESSTLNIKSSDSGNVHGIRCKGSNFNVSNCKLDVNVGKSLSEDNTAYSIGIECDEASNVSITNSDIIIKVHDAIYHVYGLFGGNITIDKSSLDIQCIVESLAPDTSFAMISKNSFTINESYFKAIACNSTTQSIAILNEAIAGTKKATITDSTIDATSGDVMTATSTRNLVVSGGLGANSDMEITDTEITTKSGKCLVSTPGTNQIIISAGIYCLGNWSFDGGTIDSQAGESYISGGIVAYPLNGGSISSTITSGTVVAKAGIGYCISSGIAAPKYVQNGGKVTAIGGKCKCINPGILPGLSYGFSAGLATLGSGIALEDSYLEAIGGELDTQTTSEVLPSGGMAILQNDLNPSSIKSSTIYLTTNASSQNDSNQATTIATAYMGTVDLPTQSGVTTLGAQKTKADFSEINKTLGSYSFGALKIYVVDSQYPAGTISQFENVTVTFDSDGGTAVAPITTQKNNTIEEPTPPTKEGNEFDGWYTTDGNEFDFSTPITENITLKAKWNSASPDYAIAFDGFKFINKSTGDDITDMLANKGLTIENYSEITMNNFSFETSCDCALVLLDAPDVKVNVKGENLISSTNSEHLSLSLVQSAGVKFVGEGTDKSSLTLNTADNSNIKVIENINYDLNISKCSFNLNAAKSLGDSYNRSYCIYCDDSSVNISDSKIVAKSDVATTISSCLYAENTTIKNSEIDFETLVNENYLPVKCFGIDAGGILDIQKSDLKLKSGNATNQTFALLNERYTAQDPEAKTIISDSTIEATSGTILNESSGASEFVVTAAIGSNCACEITNTDITGTAQAATVINPGGLVGSAGIYCLDDISFDGGTINVQSGASLLSVGILAFTTQGTKIPVATIKDGEIQATSGNAYCLSGGICCGKYVQTGGEVTATGGKCKCIDSGMLPVPYGFTTGLVTLGSNISVSGESELTAIGGEIDTQTTATMLPSSGLIVLCQDGSASNLNDATVYSTSNATQNANDNAAMVVVTGYIGTSELVSEKGYSLFGAAQTNADPDDINEHAISYDAGSGLMLYYLLSTSLPAGTLSQFESATVTFDSNGGSKVDPAIAKLNTAITEPEEPTKAGSEFKGWYKDDVKFDFSTAITEDITLTAKWQSVAPVEVDVTFSENYEGGSSVVKKQTVGEYYYLPDYPIRDGYSCQGWFTASTGGNLVTAITVVENDQPHTLYAHWVAQEIVVPTDDPDISVNVEDMKLVHDEIAALNPDARSIKAEMKINKNQISESDMAIIKQHVGDKPVYGSEVYIQYTLNGDESTTQKFEENLVPVGVTYKFDFTNKTNVMCVRVVDGEYQVLTTTPNERGEFVEYNIEKGEAIIHAIDNAAYAFTYDVATDPTPQPTPDSGNTSNGYTGRSGSTGDATPFGIMAIAVVVAAGTIVVSRKKFN